MAESGKSLTELLKDKATESNEAEIPKAQKKKKVVRKKSRQNTVLIGGHFSPNVLRQLKIIAAEEGTTNQALLGEALDLLFLKKGKKKMDV